MLVIELVLSPKVWVDETIQQRREILLIPSIGRGKKGERYQKGFPRCWFYLSLTNAKRYMTLFCSRFLLLYIFSPVPIIYVRSRDKSLSSHIVASQESRK